MPAEEIVFDSDVYLVLPKKAEEYKASKPILLTLEPQAETATAGEERALIEDSANARDHQLDDTEQGRAQKNRTLRIHGEIPTEVWQRLGRTLIPKLKGVADLRVGLDVSLSLDRDGANGLQHEIHQILQDLKLEEKVKVEWK